MNKSNSFHWSQKLLHWLMAILVIAMLLMGIGLTHSVSERHTLLVAYHKPLGMLIFALVIVRLLVRWRLGAPALPATLAKPQQLAARISHWLLYALLIAQPLCGIFMVWCGSYPLPGANHAALPYPQTYAMLRTLHSVLAYSLLGLIALHLTAALVHGLIYRDGVMRSMGFGGKRRFM
ncbi:cytochrome b [Teredinibacter turnerae]|uniref:cytochrome b n=1 Tax=Teredinibacter turnerae TaxID=2426 RepID=UPI0005F7786C|nr:cytochrome b [Teredinibacter turnerae]